MTDPNDIINKVYTRLIPIKVVGKNKHGFYEYLCKCSCGNEKIIMRNSLMSGKSQSCGCLNKEKSPERAKLRMQNIDDKFIGQKFGLLTVIARHTKRDSDDKFPYVCKCDCGKEKIIAKTNLVGGRSKSCGCYNTKCLIKRGQDVRDSFDSEQYIGQKFDRLTVIEYILDNYDHKFKCLCECGNSKIALFSNLKSGNTKSCGCLINEKAAENFNNYNKQQRLDKGLNENQFLTDVIPMVRARVFEPIKQLIIKVDRYTCNLCFKRFNQVHHIDSIFNNLIVNNEDSYCKVYEINNLVCLCHECHKKAHNYNTKDIDLKIQNDLLTITSMRVIPKNIQNQYDKIVEQEIKPWIKKYIATLNINNTNDLLDI